MFLANLLGVIAAFPLFSIAQNVTVLTDDPRMHFDGTWVVQGSGEWEFTATVGTAIYWHAAFNPRCGLALVSIDGSSGVTVDASSGVTSKNAIPIPAILFEQTGLQNGQNHTINITLLGVGSLRGSYLEMWNLTYTTDASTSLTGSGSALPGSTGSAGAGGSLSVAPGSLTVIESSKTVTKTTTVAGSVETIINTVTSAVTATVSTTAAVVASSSSFASHRSNAGAIAGGVVGGLAVLLLMAGLLLCWRRRRAPSPEAKDTSSQSTASQRMIRDIPLDAATSQGAATVDSVPSSPASPIAMDAASSSPIMTETTLSTLYGRPSRALPIPPTVQTQTANNALDAIAISRHSPTALSDDLAPLSPPPPYTQDRISHA
ncbi:hypothetical protein HWV62_34445 [Athelia sp. TMB]|nr:hypothetical protein HWV62_34445 [Athelia sp. TMB]